MPERRPALRAVLSAATLSLVLVHPASAVPDEPAGDPGPSTRLERYRRALDFPDLVRGGTVDPHWLPDGDAFWYEATGPEGETVIYRVDPSTGEKERLAEPPGPRTPAEEPRIIRQSIFPGFPPVREVPSPDGKWFLTERDHDLWLRAAGSGDPGEPAQETLRRLTDDGTAEADWRVVQDDLWMRAIWSPDSDRLLAIREDRSGVDRDPVVDWLERSPTVRSVPLAKAGRPLARTELWVITIATGQRVRLALGPDDVYQAPVGWLGERPATSVDATDATTSADSDGEILLITAARNFSSVRLLAADPRTGTVRTVIEERSDTFIKNLCIAPEWTELATVVPAGSGPARIVWQSERDGWDHLELYDLEGTLLRRLTPADPERPWPVIRVVAVDSQAGDPGAGGPGWVYFTAHAEPGRPYQTHLYRVRLDHPTGLGDLSGLGDPTGLRDPSGPGDLNGLSGMGFERLTDGPGEHDVVFSPSRRLFLDTWSSLDRPPRTELRRADGTLVGVLETADVSALAPLGLRPPEPFTVKTQDGTTDLAGVLYLPADFDPRLRYPVIEDLYAGPFRVHHQRRFSTGSPLRGTFAQALAQLGFVVVTLDGPGTPERGKAFQDVVWRRFGQIEIPEHAAAIRRLASSRPWMDLTRVGAFGGSWGGYMTVRALLTAPDLYRVGVAVNPVVDFYDHGATGLEGYMDLPENNPEGYAAGSNLALADRLEGKLLLMHGTADVNATFSTTMKMVDALARAGKPYDLIVLPGQTHHYRGYALDYRREAIRRYFQEHLQEP